MRISLRTRLVLSFLVIILVTTTIFVLLSNRVILSRFTDLVARSGQSYARRVVPLTGTLLSGKWQLGGN